MQYPDGFVDSYRRRGICGVLSVAICADVSFDVAKQACKLAMHKLYPDRKRFRGGTYYDQRLFALRMLGIKVVEHDRFQGLAVATFAAKHAQPNATYMVCVPRHVLTVQNGLVCDQSALKDWFDHKQAIRIINKPVIEIIGKGW